MLNKNTNTEISFNQIWKKDTVLAPLYHKENRFWFMCFSILREAEEPVLSCVYWWWGYQDHDLPVFAQIMGSFSNCRKECVHSNTSKTKKLQGEKLQKPILDSRTPFDKLNSTKENNNSSILKDLMETTLPTNRCLMGLFRLLYGYVI